MFLYTRQAKKMKIIFGPTKLFNEKAQITTSETIFNDMTNKIVKNIKKHSKKSLQTTYKVSDKLIDTIYDYYQNFDSNQRYVAFDFYLGESFKHFEFNTLDEQQITYLNSHVYIIDALYGIIKPLDGIKPYRMDFTIKDSNKLWKKQINTYFKDEQHQVFLSLASKEFGALIDKSKFDVYEVSFTDCKDGICKKVSVFNKQMRGKLLRYIVEHKIDNIDALPNIFNVYKKDIEGFDINYTKTI